MARPAGRFHRNAEQLLTMLKYLGSNRTNAELAEDMEVGVSQIANYLRHLKSTGKIVVRTSKVSFKGNIKSRRTIEVK